MQKIISLIFVILIVTSAFGSSIGSIDLLFFQLTPYRIVLFVLFFIVMLAQRKGVAINSNKRIKFVFLYLLGIYSILSLLWVKSIEAWARIEYFIISFYLLIYIFNYVLRMNHGIRLSFFALQLSVFVQGSIGFYEVFSGDYFFALRENPEYLPYFIHYHNVPIAMMYNPNNMALFLLLGICLCFAGLYIYKGLARLINIIILPIYGYLLYLTDSRANLVAMILVVFVFLLINIKKTKNKLAFLCLGIIIGLIIVINKIDAFEFEKIQNDLRWNIYKNGFDFLMQTGGLGVGVGQSSYWLENYSTYSVDGVFAFHNLWLEILFSCGIVVFLSFLYTYFSILVISYKTFNIRTNKISRATSMFLFLFFIGLVIGCFSPSNMLSFEWLWILLSFSICSINILQKSKPIIGQRFAFNG